MKMFACTCNFFINFYRCRFSRSLASLIITLARITLWWAKWKIHSNKHEVASRHYRFVNTTYEGACPRSPLTRGCSHIIMFLKMFCFFLPCIWRATYWTCLSAAGQEAWELNDAICCWRSAWEKDNNYNYIYLHQHAFNATSYSQCWRMFGQI